jgi:hypothetical protein
MSRPRRAPLRTAVPTALLCAVAALCGCVTADAEIPAAELGVSSEPLPTAPVDVRVLGATGDVVWASFSEPSEPGRHGQQVSLDGGTTWQPGPVWPEIGAASAGNGRLGLYGGDDGEAWPQVIDPAHPASATALTWNEEWHLRAVGPTLALATNGRLASATKAVKVAFPALPSGHGTWKHSYRFSTDPAFLVRVSHASRGSSDYLTVVDTATAKAAKPVRVPRSSAHAVGATSLVTLVADATGLSVCRQPLAGGAQSCQVVATGDHRRASTRLSQAGDVSLVKDGATALMLEGGTLTPIDLPDGTASWRTDAPGDPTRPLIRTVDAAGEPHHLRVAADGSTSEWLQLSRVPVAPYSLALSPTTLLGHDGLAPDRTWLRDVTDGGLGARSGVSGAVPIDASGSRWLMLTGRTFRTYDQGGRGAAVPTALARELSGPYLMGVKKVGTVTGTVLDATRPKAIFGSLVVEDVSTSHATGYTLRVRDLAGSYSSPRFLLTDKTDLYTWVMIWGDWVGTSVFSDAPDHDIDTILYNYRTGRRITHPGVLWRLGDGIALIQTPSDDFGYPLAAWDFGADVEYPLGNGGFGACDLDGNRIAFTTSTHLVLRTVDGVATSAPRMLGVVATGRATRTSPWKAALDLTKPVAAGTLEIRTKAGTLVRTLVTAASATGSLRGIAWDGRDDAGAEVAKGTYRWTLVVSGADGSGVARDVTGTAAATGRIVRR